jgi:hypothetical protein
MDECKPLRGGLRARRIRLQLAVPGRDAEVQPVMDPRVSAEQCLVVRGGACD